MSSFSKRTSCLFFIAVFLFSTVFGGVAGGLSSWLITKNLKMETGQDGFNFGGSQVYKVEEESAYIDAVKKVSPAVVSITLTKNVTSLFGDIYQESGGGTGFIINSDGLILTNKHVVSEQNAEYSVITADGKKYDVKSKSLDPIGDLAIIKIDANALPVVELSDSDALKIGQRVIAIGNALNEYQNTVTTGIVSAVDRTVVAGDGMGQNEQLENMIQTDAAINPGNSGGPLLDISGRVIGINTAIDSQASGIGFAIPINQAKSAIESYLKSNKIVRPRLGVRYMPLSPEFSALNQLDVSEGALIYAGEKLGELPVIPGGPADKAGLQVNDIIVAINGEKISENHSLAGLLQQYQPGDEIEVDYLRKGEKQKTKIILDEMK